MAATDVRPRSFLQRLNPDRFAMYWRRGIILVLVINLTVLAWQTYHRAIFPWDMHIWAESPFMTDLLKLDHGSSVYTSPADVNSFVYSPGLEYLTYAALKPFGVELDIRYCRLVNIIIGLAAAACGALAIRQLGRSCPQMAMGRCGFWAAWAALTLMLFKNFTSDIPHPDNLHVLQALLVFYLCFTAIETKRFGFGIAAMVVAGLGVFAKQTDVVCAAGPAFAFWLFKTWDRRRWFVLIGVAALVGGVSLWCLWMPQYAKFYTFDLLSRQARHLDKIIMLRDDLLRRERGVLAGLGVFSLFYFWKLQGAARRYLVCALSVGGAATTLTTVAYIKEFGVWNNIWASEMFIAVLVWPLIWNLPGYFMAAVTSRPEKWPLFQVLIGALAVITVLTLFPVKETPQSGYFEYCQAIESAVRDDLKAGRKVLVTHGAEFLIRAGDLEIPLDRANSSGELYAGKFGNLTGTDARLRSHYYDRVYLFVDFGFEQTELEAFHRYYHVIKTIPGYKVPHARGFASGFQTRLWGDCEILAPNEK